MNIDLKKKLLKAAVKGDIKDIKLLIDEGANIDNMLGITSFFIWASSQSHSENVIKLLLEAGANVDIQDDEGCTSLMHAIMHGQYKLVKLLLEAGANVDLEDKQGWTASMMAACCGNSDIAKLLGGRKGGKLYKDIIAKQDSAPFTMMPNKILMEPSLSNNAKVVWLYLKSRPSDWTFYNGEIMKNLKITSKTLSRTFDELENFGLVSRKRIRLSNGTLGSWNFTISKTINHLSLDNKGSRPVDKTPVVVEPLVVEPLVVNSQLLIKTNTKKEKTNISSLGDQVKKEIKRREDFEKLDKGFKVDNFVQWLEDQGDNLKTTWKGALTSWLKRPENFDRQVVITQEQKKKNHALVVGSKVSQIKGSFEFKNKVGGFDIDEIDFKSLKFDRGAYFYHYSDKFPIDKYKSFFTALKINLKKS